MKKISLIAAAFALALSGAAAAEGAKRQITVTGEGQVESVPDMATIVLGVSHEAPEARVAMSRTSAAVAEMLGQLEEMGIAARDVQTRNLSLNPVWSNRRNNSDEPAKITGFVARNSVMVRVRDLAALPVVLDTVIGAGANDFNGLQMSVEDVDTLVEGARVEAVEDATAKAKTLADAAGIELGQVVSITEHGGGRPRPMMMERAAMADGVPIAPGEVSVSASVTMVFAIGGAEASD